jgi:hypothetical protein
MGAIVIADGGVGWLGLIAAGFSIAALLPMLAPCDSTLTQR